VSDHDKQAVAARLTAVVEESGHARGAFARLIGVGDTTLKSYMAGNTEPGVSELVRFCDLGKVRLDWLVYGRGPRRPDEVPESVAVAGDPNDWFHRLTVEAVVMALEEELQAQAISPTPAKQADLVVALCLIFRRPDAINREAIRKLIMVAK
jgi:hypothetical protein